ncbi:hypothetical protein GOP47_0017824 [Adiantum capillus-veneris]|uniref:non-specific serine/threonine protein kinase n=1 Tax=Adiantum capillus-veneris TaxID=13818 RepID=A0A9D4UG49_ADICA|nr:hypothetical protein GOP47_0017824 [Adiantum capillus-veneris]
MGNCYGKWNAGENVHDLSSAQNAKLSLQSAMGKQQPDTMKTVAPIAPVVQVDRPKEAPKVLPVHEPVNDTPFKEISALPAIQAHVFTLQELATASNNFSEDCLVGEGGFGPVYKGQLADGKVVAIKQLNKDGLQGNREFLVEVLMLSLLHHENLVNLIGYCAEGEQRLLVYEYMALGSLEDHLHDLPFGIEPLDWPTRMKIAAGAGRGLEYLHDTANPPVIYRDLKGSNILLGDDFHPKLSDFGLAKLGPVGDKTHVSTRVMGTYGYCAPEYAMTGQLTMKSDVYSFGVVLLELITGRKAIDQSRPSGEHNLVAWARPLFKDRSKFAQMADPKLRGCFPVRGLFQALAVAAMCLHEQAASRPSIADVVTALNYLACQTSGQAQELSPSHPQAKGCTKPKVIEDSYEQPVSVSNGSATLQEEEKADSCTDKADLRGSEMHNKSTNDWKAQTISKAREQAVAEARQWGAALRERRDRGG